METDSFPKIVFLSVEKTVSLGEGTCLQLLNSKTFICTTRVIKVIFLGILVQRMAKNIKFTSEGATSTMF